MSVSKSKDKDYASLKPLAPGNRAGSDELSTLKPSSAKNEEVSADLPDFVSGLSNPAKISEPENKLSKPASKVEQSDVAEPPVSVEEAASVPEEDLSYSEQLKLKRKQKIVERDKKLLGADNWLARRGHGLTYLGIFLFTLILYFRPYEWIPSLSGFTSAALIVAVVTLLVYLPSQLTTEGNVTIFTTEVKCLLFIVFWAVLTMPIAKDPGMAWKELNENYIKVVLIFIVMINTLRTKTRLMGLMWLSIASGLMVSMEAVAAYSRGEFKVEGYRVEVDLGGMFGNPNDAALHLVIFTPIAIVLGVASKRLLSKLIYFASAGLMIAGNMVTQSRGGFLGLLAIGVALAWKLGKKQRFKVAVITAVIAVVVILFAPGNYGLRMLSIFVPGLDPVGSSDQRRELLQRSLLVTLRNPWGIGMGNFPIVGIRNLVTHNAYTQVSSELGVLSFIAYMIFMISPFRKLSAIERQLDEKDEHSWIYYLSIGVQVSIIGYMVSSFFASVAYLWFIYYPIAYAICLRRIYKLSDSQGDASNEAATELPGYFKASQV